MANNILQFSLITVPQTIILTLLLWGLFRLLFRFQVSILFRRFSLFVGSVGQSLFEGNAAYFCYLAFNQTRVMFSFTWTDRIFLGYSLAIFFIVIIFCICFFFLISFHYQKTVGYFIYYYYRTF